MSSGRALPIEACADVTGVNVVVVDWGGEEALVFAGAGAGPGMGVVGELVAVVGDSETEAGSTAVGEGVLGDELLVVELLVAVKAWTVAAEVAAVDVSVVIIVDVDVVIDVVALVIVNCGLAFPLSPNTSQGQAR
jgi:hypothetical protein